MSRSISGRSLDSEKRLRIAGGDSSSPNPGVPADPSADDKTNCGYVASHRAVQEGDTERAPGASRCFGERLRVQSLMASTPVPSLLVKICRTTGQRISISLTILI